MQAVGDFGESKCCRSQRNSRVADDLQRSKYCWSLQNPRKWMT